MSASRAALAAALFCGGLCVPSGASAQESRITFDLPAQPLETSLREVALRAGQSIVAPTETVAGRQAPALVGRYTVAEAVKILLGGSGLKATQIGASFVIGQDETATATTDAPSSDIVVTGSRIRGAGPAGSKVVTIDREAIDRSGYATTQQIAQSIPQNFGGGPNEGVSGVGPGRDNAGLNQSFGSSVNLRGLGSTSTLVLLDGVRPALGGFSGVFSDLSLVPLTAIERIEVLPDGASAIYGADAVAGVVNVITRRQVDGVETRLRFGTGDGDFNEVQAGAIAGARWETGHVTAAYEFYGRDPLRARNRDYATEDLRPFGGPDYRSTFAAPGTLFVGGQSFALPPGQDGAGLRSDQLVRGAVNRRDRWANADLLPRQERHGATAAVEQELGPTTSLFGRVLLAERRYERRDRASLNEVTAVVPTTNPFYINPLGNGAPVGVRYAFETDLGPETSSGVVRAISGVAGLRQELGQWRAEAFANYGIQRERARVGNLVNTARLTAALADPDRRTAYNVFGSGGLTDRGTVDRVRGSTSSDGRFTIWSAAAKLDGPLFRLPAGEVRVAVGGEHREERFETSEDVVDRSTPVPQRLRVTDLPGTRRIVAAYAEILLPLAGPDAPLPGARRLDLSLAGRIERYSDFGETANPKVGLRWDPFAGLALRASYGTSFRAPSFNDLRQGPAFRLIFPILLADPSAPGGQRGVLVRRGNDPDLGPEQATTWTLGADLRPAFLPGFSAAATYFNIRYRDRIASPSADLLAFLTDRERFAPILNEAPTSAEIAALYADPAFINPFAVPASNVFVIADARAQNLSVTKQQGFDLELAYSLPAADGRLTLNAAGTYLTKLDQALTSSAPSTDVLATYGFPTRFRARGSTSWSRRRFSAAASVNHISGYRNTLGGGDERVSAWTTLDLQVSYGFGTDPDGRDTVLALNATNLFDRDPPYVRSFDGLSAVGFDPQAANALGRVVSIEWRRRW